MERPDPLSQVRAYLATMSDVPGEIADILQGTILDDDQSSNPARLDQLEQDATRAHLAALSLLADLLYKPAASPDDAILHELQMMRAWQRARRLLEAGFDAVDVVRIVAANRLQRRALRDELPVYLLSRGEGNRIQHVLKLIDDAELDVLSPVQQQARQLSREIAEGWPRVMQALADGRAALAGEPITAIILWSGRESQFTPS
jgi:hypothetical protein